MRMKKIVAVSVLILMGLGSGNALADKTSSALPDKNWRRITIGCSPDFKMYSIECKVGNTWQSCAKEFCGFKLVGATGTEKARIMADPKTAPRLLAPDPAAPR